MLNENQFQNDIQNEMIQESPQKRRGRPEKKPEPFFEEGEQLFTLHDHIFHAAIMFYTFRIFDKAPTRKKFNPTIGFSVYGKVKNFPPELKKYFDCDDYALQESKQFEQNFHLQHFFINSLTFGPKCVIEQFYQLFHFILMRLTDKIEPSPEQCLEFIKEFNIKYINFDNQVLDFLEARTPAIRENLKQVINSELKKLLEIIVHTLDCLLKNEKQNKFACILESDENMFERGIHTKNKKKVKKQ